MKANFDRECLGGYTDDDGRYTFADLGPYAWPLEFTSSNYPWQWSGGARDRKHAKPVQVRVGQQAVANAALVKGSTVKGTVVGGASHAPVRWASVFVVDANSGEAVGSLSPVRDGSYSVPVLPGSVRIGYSGENTGTFWYSNAADFAHAKRVTVGSKDITLELVLPGI
jgi:hypothetical protein